MSNVYSFFCDYNAFRSTESLYCIVSNDYCETMTNISKLKASI